MSSTQTGADIRKARAAERAEAPSTPPVTAHPVNPAVVVTTTTGAHLGLRADLWPSGGPGDGDGDAGLGVLANGG